MTCESLAELVGLLHWRQAALHNIFGLQRCAQPRLTAVEGYVGGSM